MVSTRWYLGCLKGYLGGGPIYNLQCRSLGPGGVPDPAAARVATAPRAQALMAEVQETTPTSSWRPRDIFVKIYTYIRRRQTMMTAIIVIMTRIITIIMNENSNTNQ